MKTQNYMKQIISLCSTFWKPHLNLWLYPSGSTKSYQDTLCKHYFYYWKFQLTGCSKIKAVINFLRFYLFRFLFNTLVPTLSLSNMKSLSRDVLREGGVRGSLNSILSPISKDATAAQLYCQISLADGSHVATISSKKCKKWYVSFRGHECSPFSVFPILPRILKCSCSSCYHAIRRR